MASPRGARLDAARGGTEFGDIEVITVQASPAPGMPGYTMLRLTTSDEPGPGDVGPDSA
jgi:hypothetical protein